MNSPSSTNPAPPLRPLAALPHLRTMLRPSSSSSSTTTTVGTPSTPFATPQAVHLAQPVTSLSISPNGQEAVLAAKKGLYIIDLENLTKPPRVIHHMTNWDVSDSNQKALVWNLETSPSGSTTAGRDASSTSPSSTSSTKHIQHILGSHQRAVSDLNWSPFHPDVLATCSYDSYVHLWDLRTVTDKPETSFCAWTAGATQVKFNRLNEHLLASSHDTDVKIWDIRKGSTPVTMITAHMTKIYGIDWSRNNEAEIITCSQDRLVKFWDITEPRTCQATIMTGSPVWRARFTPFGNGIVTMPQRKDTNLLLWSCDNLTAPVYSFEGHTDVPREFVWRVRGGSNADMVDHRSFQLVTWSKDQHLRLWPISPDITKAVGHQLIRESDSPLPDYDDEPHSPTQSALHRRTSSEPGAVLSIPAEVSFGNRSHTAILTTDPIRRGSHHQSNSTSLLGEPDPTRDWLESHGFDDSTTSQQPASPRTETGEKLPWTLNREIGEVMRAYPAVQFEKVNLAKRQCTITLQSAADTSSHLEAPIPSAFLRLDVTFPQQYPYRAAPVFTFQKTGMVSMANRRVLAAKISGIATSLVRKSLPCLDACLRYLLFGHVPPPSSPTTTTAGPRFPDVRTASSSSLTLFPTSTVNTAAAAALCDADVTTSANDVGTALQRTMPPPPPLPIPSFDSDMTTSSDSDASALADSTLLMGKRKFQDKRLLKEVIVGTESRNVPFPRLCGASFSPNGQLVYFFSTLPHPSTTKFTAYSLVTRNQQPVLQSQHFTTQPRTFSLYENYRAFVFTKFPKSSFVAGNLPREHHHTHHHHHPQQASAWGAAHAPADSYIVPPTADRQEGRGKFSYWLDSDESGDESVAAPSLFCRNQLTFDHRAPPATPPHTTPFHNPRPVSTPTTRTPSGSMPRAHGMEGGSRTQSLTIDPAAALALSSSYAGPATPRGSPHGTSAGPVSDASGDHPPPLPILHRAATVGGGIGLALPHSSSQDATTIPTSSAKTTPMRLAATSRPATAASGPRSTTPNSLATSPTLTTALARRAAYPGPHHPHRRRRANSMDMGSVSGGSEFGGSEIPSSFEERTLPNSFHNPAPLLPPYAYPFQHEHVANNNNTLNSNHDLLLTSAASLASSPREPHYPELSLHQATIDKPPPPPRTAFGITVHVRDVNALLPVSQTLASEYSLSGTDPVAICSRNAAAAGRIGRKDLMQIWSLAALLLTAQCDAGGGGAAAESGPKARGRVVVDQRSRRPRRRRGDLSAVGMAAAAPPRWRWHPFGRKMVHDIFAFCERCGDVQTLAMLVCVFSPRLASSSRRNMAGSGSEQSVQLATTTTTGRAADPSAVTAPLRQTSQSYFRQHLSSTTGGATNTGMMTAMVAGMITPPLSAAFSMMGVAVSSVRTSPDSDTVALQLTSLAKEAGGNNSAASGPGGGGASKRTAGWLRAGLGPASSRPSSESLSKHVHHSSIDSHAASSSQPASPGTGTPLAGSYAGEGGLWHHGSGGAAAAAGDATLNNSGSSNTTQLPDGVTMSRSSSATYAQAAAGGLTSPPIMTTSNTFRAQGLRHATTGSAAATISIAAAAGAQLNSSISSRSNSSMPGLHRQRSQDAWMGAAYHHHHQQQHSSKDSAPPSPKPQPSAAVSGWTLTAPIASVMTSAPVARWTGAGGGGAVASSTPPAQYTPPAVSTSLPPTPPTPQAQHQHLQQHQMVQTLQQQQQQQPAHSSCSSSSSSSSSLAAVFMLRLTEDEDAERHTIGQGTTTRPPAAAAAAVLPLPSAHGDAHLLLDPHQQHWYDAYCVGYADLLYMWGLVEQRAEVLKFVGAAANEVGGGGSRARMAARHVGVDVGMVCPGCATLLTPNAGNPTTPAASAHPFTSVTTTPTTAWSYCWRCDRKRYGLLAACSVCHLPARGLAAFCTVCSHESWWEGRVGDRDRDVEMEMEAK
ncbi:hypothetical protein PhCBS80983_g00188 [Powellomyces hirtus]|uniref:Uncharacterized protein n=1 Tax=Powellomyces hirtus TaxID=109895 RepID=A0A507EHR6_9FUNG|nr:hypothetical protein PhCBS80983_g00188 [Powellomyces hirtus]